MRRKRRQSEKQTQFVLSLSRLSEQVALDYCLAIPSSLRSSLRVPSSSKTDVFNARRCLAHLSVAFSSFVKTKFCRIFPIQTTAPFLMLPFIARQALSLACRLFLRLRLVVGAKLFILIFLTKNLSLSLAPPLSPKQISASLPHFVCFIFNKKFPPLLVGIFISFADF